MKEFQTNPGTPPADMITFVNLNGKVKTKRQVSLIIRGFGSPLVEIENAS